MKLKKAKIFYGGNDYSVPTKFFNPNTDFPKYYPKGHPILQPKNNSYGPSIAISNGKSTGNCFPGMYGPNLAPYPVPSGLQTGGKTLKMRNYWKD